MIPIVDEATLRASVTPARAVAAIREAFRADGEGRTRVPPVITSMFPPRAASFTSSQAG
jgi:ornithine cyclodeaminase/alanine dehydrogenase-like protein (mu-crystallin family)